MTLPSVTRFILCSLGLITGSAHAAVSIDFETGSELGSAFRVGANGGYTQSSNGAGNDVLNFVQGASASTIFYDANGAGAGVSAFAVSVGNPLTVSTSVVLPSTNGSFGIFFANPLSGANANLALFNVNYQSTALDQFRFDNAFNASTGVVGALSQPAGGSVDAGVTVGTAFTMTATYTVLSATSYRVTMSVGSATFSTDYTGTPLSLVEVGFRTNPTGTLAGSLDNLTINLDPVTVVPEPSTALLGLAGALALVGLRRRA